MYDGKQVYQVSSLDDPRSPPLPSYQSATIYARNSFDLFYLTLNFLIVYIALIVFYEKVLRDKCKELFIRIMSNPKKDKQG